MSYGRKPYYIYDDGECICFNCNKRIPNDEINQFLYMVLGRKEELKQRVKKGRKMYLKALEEDEFTDEETLELQKNLEGKIVKELLDD